MRFRNNGTKKTEGMVQARDLFAKYKSILKAPESSVINTFIEVVDDLYGWPIKKEQVSYSPQTKTLTLSASGALKSELQLHKKELLTHMKGRLGQKNAPQTIL